jgi:flagellar biosynthetic protein FlhB
MPSGEKTEAATPRRREELRQQGRVARSVEISAAASLVALVLVARFLGGGLVRGLGEFFAQRLSHAGGVELTPAALRGELLGAGLGMAKVLAPLALATCVGGVVGGVSQVGFLVSFHPLKFDWEKLNPVAGLGRIFSWQAVAGVAKSLAKAGLVGYLIYAFLRANAERLVGLGGLGTGAMGEAIGELLWGLMVRCAGALAVIAFLDYVFQRFQFEKNIRMTKFELKEELKRTEGDPLAKARRRRRQREIAHHRMMEAARRATVVVTNPVRLAVALRYEASETTAPVVVAKGQRLIAERIREIAKEEEIPVVENAPLAQTLFKSVKVGAQIPPELYQAVAEVIAFVYRMSGKSAQAAGAGR